MANPRKFSEKIALHNQKQAEETAEFEKIMREVSDATNKVSGCKRQQLHINQSLGPFRGGSLPNVNKVMMSQHLELKSTLSCMDDLKNVRSSSQTYRERPRSAVGPMRSRPAEKRIDTSPYSTIYLSPPPDTTWRRTHSDSALHTSSHDSSSFRKSLDCHSHMMDSYDSNRRLSSASPEARPRSVSDMPRVPGISIFPSQESGAIQIPIGNNTGSLPDLTSFHIPSPLNTPLDREELNSQCVPTGAYCGIPRSLTPTSHLQTARFGYAGTPPNEAPGPPLLNNASHLSVPSYASHKGLQQNRERHEDSFNSPYLPPISSLQSAAISTTEHQNSVSERSGSQRMSPSLTVYKYGNASPCGSSPQSPASPASVGCSMNCSTEHNNYFIGQTNALQHHFEQFSMMDSPADINIDYAGSTNSTSLLQNEESTKMRSHELTPDPGYFSTSPSQHNPYSRAAQETTSPNTPSSIPDIVLTDFSNSEELSKDFGVNIGALDSDLFPTDECLREGLTPLDLDSLQMLNYPDMIADPATEDHLRLDRLDEWEER